MGIITDEVKEQVLTLVQKQKKTKIKWIASIVFLTEEQLIELAPTLELSIDGDYLVVPQKLLDKNKHENMTKEEYDKLNPKPASTFCDAKASRKKY